MIFLFISGGLELGGGLLAAAARPKSNPERDERPYLQHLFVDVTAALFTTDSEAIALGALLLSRECWTYPLTNLRHLQEARLRGHQHMGLYLTSNVLTIAANLTVCLILVPRYGYSGFYLTSYLVSPAGLLLSTVLVRWVENSSDSL